MKKQKPKSDHSLLYYGDNLEILRTKIDDDSVDLCYIDPPFNSKRNYNQIYNNLGNEDRAQAQAFIDTWTWDDYAITGWEELLANDKGRFSVQLVELIKGLHAVLGEGSLLAYLISLSLRATEIQRVLKPSGSFYLHCDPTASHYLKIAMDAIFCANGGDFLNEVIWRRTGSHNATKTFGPIHDVLLVYSKSLKHFFNVVRRPYMKGHVLSRYTPMADGRMKFTSGGNVLSGAGATKGESGKPWKGFDPSSKGRHWAIPSFYESVMPEEYKEFGPLKKLDALLRAGHIEIEEGNEWPTMVRYLDERDGAPIQDVWAYQPYTDGTVWGTEKGIDVDVAWHGPTDPERLGYPTQKPEGLLERILRASSPEGGVVLDAYCGCGTTVAVAQRLGRKWIGIDITYQSISLILRRLEKAYGPKVLEAVTTDGIPKDMESASALAHKKDDRLRKEFEKWAVLTYTNNRAVINDKKGADAGIDARAFFRTGKNDNAKIVFQVKSGDVKRGDVAALRGDMERERAALAVLLTLEEPTAAMRKEAKAAGQYIHAEMAKAYDKITIVEIRDVVEKGERLTIPMSLEVLAAAKKAADSEQIGLFGAKAAAMDAPPQVPEEEMSGSE